jgi:four helix bundle protein
MNKSLELEKNKGWREARDLAAAVYRISPTGGLNFDLGLRAALRHFSIAVMSHISLGQKGFDAEFRMVQLYYARSSAAALYTILAVSRKAGTILESDFLELEDRVHRICDQVDGMLREIDPLFSSLEKSDLFLRK